MNLVLATLALAVVAPQAPKAAKEEGIVTLVKSKIADPAKPFTILVTVKVKEGQNEAFEAAHKLAATGTAKEAGFVAYDLNRSTESPQSYFLYERFKSLAALELHLKEAHTVKLVTAFPGFFDGPAKVEIFAIPGESTPKGK